MAETPQNHPFIESTLKESMYHTQLDLCAVLNVLPPNYVKQQLGQQPLASSYDVLFTYALVSLLHAWAGLCCHVSNNEYATSRDFQNKARRLFESFCCKDKRCLWWRGLCLLSSLDPMLIIRSI